MPSQCECVRVSIICTFGLIQHTLIGPQHIYPASVHRSHSLFSREKNLYGFSAVDVGGHRSKCVCKCVFSLFSIFENENDGIFLFHVTAKRLHNCACTPGFDLQCCNFGLSVLSILRVKFIRNGKFCHFLTLMTFQTFFFLFALSSKHKVRHLAECSCCSFASIVQGLSKFKKDTSKNIIKVCQKLLCYIPSLVNRFV